MSQFVGYDKVKRMLEDCAPGVRIRPTTHGRIVSYGGLIYRNLPKHDEIEIGHIRKMVRHFGITDCARKHGVI